MRFQGSAKKNPRRRISFTSRSGTIELKYRPSGKIRVRVRLGVGYSYKLVDKLP